MIVGHRQTLAISTSPRLGPMLGRQLVQLNGLNPPTFASPLVLSLSMFRHCKKIGMKGF